jgi:hypothetical protein
LDLCRHFGVVGVSGLEGGRSGGEDGWRQCRRLGLDDNLIGRLLLNIYNGFSVTPTRQYRLLLVHRLDCSEAEGTNHGFEAGSGSSDDACHNVALVYELDE